MQYKQISSSYKERKKTPHQFSVENDEVFDYLFNDYNLTILVACKPR